MWRSRYLLLCLPFLACSSSSGSDAGGASKLDGGLAGDAGVPGGSVDGSVSGGGALLDALNAAQEAIAARATDVVLTPDGLTHLKITWQGDFRTHEQLEVGGVVHWIQDSTATQSVARDQLNAQGILERTKTVTRDDDPMNTMVVVTVAPAGDDLYTLRETFTRDADSVSIVVETSTTPGQLVESNSFETPITQAAVGSGPTPGTGPGDCTPAQASKAQGDLNAALKKGLESCLLSGLDPKLQECLTAAAAQGIALSCSALPGTEYAEVGWWDTLTHGGFGGAIAIAIDPSRFFGTDDASQQLFLWHELNHVCLGAHNPFDIAGADDGADILANDQVYACSSLCFDPNATKCQCASCLGVDPCDRKCARFQECADEAKCNCFANHRTYKTLTACNVACPSGLACFAASCDKVPMCGS